MWLPNHLTALVYIPLDLPVLRYCGGFLGSQLEGCQPDNQFDPGCTVNGVTSCSSWLRFIPSLATLQAGRLELPVARYPSIASTVLATIEVSAVSKCLWIAYPCCESNTPFSIDPFHQFVGRGVSNLINNQFLQDHTKISEDLSST